MDDMEGGKKGRVESPQVTSDHYFDFGYDTKGRFVSYWYQIKEVRSLYDGKVLEIGPGNNFISEYLEKRDVSVVTMDIDPELDVDIIGSVTDIPCEDNTFSVAACFEVLEHMPYEEALAGLRELDRVARDFVIFSVPDYEHAIWGNIRLPFLGKIKWFFSLPRPFPYEQPQVEDQHFWEIGMRHHSAQQVQDDVQKLGFDIVRTYRIQEKDDHRFFVLRPS